MRVRVPPWPLSYIFAVMVELADTQASGACYLKQVVGVQLSLTAPTNLRTW